MKANTAGRIRIGLAATVVVVVCGLLAGGPAEASCRLVSVEEDLESSDLVFVGSVTHLANDDRWATFRIEQVWKGDPGSDRVEVRAGPVSGPGSPAASSVDRSYVAGERYLVFASDLSRRLGVVFDFGEGARWIDSACSATRPYEASLDQFRPAGAGPVPPGSESDGAAMRWLVATVVATVALTGVAVVALRRRRWNALTAR